jgi:hypothetical protein
MRNVDESVKVVTRTSRPSDVDVEELLQQLFQELGRARADTERARADVAKLRRRAELLGEDTTFGYLMYSSLPKVGS